MINSVEGYINRYYDNKNLPSAYDMACEIAKNEHVSVFLRLTALTSLRLMEVQDTILIQSMRSIAAIVHDISGEWMDEVSAKNSVIRQDLAEWIIGRKVGAVVNSYVAGSRIEVSQLKGLVFESMSLAFTLRVSGEDILIERAVRLDPKAASVFT